MIFLMYQMYWLKIKKSVEDESKKTEIRTCFFYAECFKDFKAVFIFLLVWAVNNLYYFYFVWEINEKIYKMPNFSET